MCQQMPRAEQSEQQERHRSRSSLMVFSAWSEQSSKSGALLFADLPSALYSAFVELVTWPNTSAGTGQSKTGCLADTLESRNCSMSWHLQL